MAQFGDAPTGPQRRRRHRRGDRRRRAGRGRLARRRRTPPNERFAVTVPGTSGRHQRPRPGLDRAGQRRRQRPDAVHLQRPDRPAQRRSSCYAIFSNAETAVGRADILVTGPNTLQVEFDESFSNVTELVVGGGDAGGCVSDANTDETPPRAPSPRAATSAPRRPATSTGPDAQALTINRTNDRRSCGSTRRSTREHLESGAASTWSAPTAATSPRRRRATVPTQGPGPQPLTLDFGASRDPRGHGRDPLRRRLLRRLLRRAVDVRLRRYRRMRQPRGLRRREERRPGVRRRRACPSVAASTRSSSSRAGGRVAARSSSGAKGAERVRLRPPR